jgi:hypothetical protein
VTAPPAEAQQPLFGGDTEMGGGEAPQPQHGGYPQLPSGQLVTLLQSLQVRALTSATQPNAALDCIPPAPNSALG